MTRSDPSINPKRAVVAVRLPCRSCGYNLQGVRLDSACPECGLEVAATLDAMLDPAAGDLPHLRRPQAVGNALVWLMLCLLATGSALLVPRVIATARHSLRDGAAASVESWWSLLAAACALAGLWSCYIFLTPLKDETDPVVHRNVRFICMGLIATAIVAGAQWYMVEFAMLNEPSFVALMLRIGLAAGAMVAFAGTGGIVHEIGRRSRVYRESNLGRQSMRAMNAAVAVLALASISSHAASQWRYEVVRVVSDFIATSCALMLLIGLAYLVVNAWWIRAAVRKPQPRLKDLVRIEPDTSWASRQSDAHTG